MRVIAGKFRSRPLHSTPGYDLRPTSDRLRETLFNVLTAGNPAALDGTVWVDLYAGTGAVGIEAISRGCETVYFVESAARAVELIRRNLHSLKIEAGFEIITQDAVRGLQALALRSITADFIFLDPPYSMEQEYRDTLAALSHSTVMKAETIVIAEHFNKFDPGESFGPLRRYRRLEQGDATLSFYRMENSIGVANHDPE
jgi:16S rRNA (guanine966-N2)-methyltransferase